VTGLSARTRLRVAGALSLLPLGLVWGPVAGPDTGHGVLGAQVPARVLLVLAAAVFLVVATKGRTRTTVRAVRVAAGAVGVGLVLALGARAVPAVLCLAAVGILVFPLARSRKPGVFVPAQVRR
jgi:hypothetical protein